MGTDLQMGESLVPGDRPLYGDMGTDPGVKEIV